MRIQILLLGALLAVGGCNGTDCNKLGGAVAITYNLDFSKVDIEKMTKGTTVLGIRVSYIKEIKNKSSEIPVRIIVDPPVEQGKEKLLATEAAVYRLMANGADFPEVREGNIVFNTLGEVGDSVDGKFFATFKDGTTLNGDFCGNLGEASSP